MTIFRSSRYAGSSVTEIVGADGKKRLYTHLRIPFTRELAESDINAVEYEIHDGDDLDLLAYKFYGTESLWWVIAEVNEITTPFELQTGLKLIIPSKEFIDNFV